MDLPCIQFTNRLVFRRVATIALAAALWAHVAAAQDAPEPGADHEAQALVREGVRLRRAHEDAQALALFRRAFAREPSSSTRAQIAFAEQALGQWVDAERDLVLALTEQDAWVSHHRPRLDEALGVIGGHLAWVRIEASAPWAEVDLDDVRVDEGREVRITAGVHHVVVREGDANESRDIDIAPREHARAIFLLDSNLRAPAAAESPAPPTVPHAGPEAIGERATPSRVGPLVLGSVGAAGLVAGSYFGLSALLAKGKRQDHCTADNACDPEGLAADSRLRSSSTASSIAFAGGAACAGGALVWWLLQRPARSVRVGLGGPAGAIGGSITGTFE